MPRPSPSITTVAQALQGGAVGYVLSQLGNPFVPTQAAMSNIYGSMPLLSAADVATVISIAQEQHVAGEMTMQAGSAETVGVFNYPLSPGVQANKVQVDVRVEIFDPTRTDAQGSPIKVAQGIVTCTSSLRDLDEAIAECVDSWVDHMTENVYRDLGGVQIVTDVVAARRGAFFGR